MGTLLFRLLAVVACLSCAACSGDVAITPTTVDSQAAVSAPPARPAEEPRDSLEGLWAGSWGGGESGGAVFQPVIAELVIQGDQALVHGFPGLEGARRTIHIDAATKTLAITPVSGAGESETPQPIAYTYELKVDQLTLTGSDGRAISFARYGLAKPPADVQVKLVPATLDEAGNLVVSEFSALRASGREGSYYHPNERRLRTAQAKMLLVEAAGVKDISLEDARKRIAEQAPVAIAFRPEDRPSAYQLHTLWKDFGSPSPEGEAARQTLARTLRPGTLVFVFPFEESVPQP